MPGLDLVPSYIANKIERIAAQMQYADTMNELRDKAGPHLQYYDVLIHQNTYVAIIWEYRLYSPPLSPVRIILYSSYENEPLTDL
jgi:hypothetical protein